MGSARTLGSRFGRAIPIAYAVGIPLGYSVLNTILWAVIVVIAVLIVLRFCFSILRRPPPGSPPYPLEAAPGDDPYLPMGSAPADVPPIPPR
jgi:hypothetical protein